MSRRRVADTDETVQACIERCQQLDPNLERRRARRAENRDKINQQNRESRQRREQGAVLLDRVERAVVREEKKDDPCREKLRRLQELVDRLQMRMERPERVQPQSRARVAEELEEPEEPRAASRQQGLPEWVRVLKQSGKAGSTQSIWQEPLRDWLSQNGFPDPNPSSSQAIREVALYLNGASRAGIPEWKRQYGREAKAAYERDFGGRRRALQ